MPPTGWPIAGAIDQTIYDAFGQEQVATIYHRPVQHKIILEVEPHFQDDPATAVAHLCAVPDRAQVPLSASSRYTIGQSTADRQPPGRVPGGDAVLQSRAWSLAWARRWSAIQQIQGGTAHAAALAGTFQGTAQAFQASLATTPLLVAAAILVVYIVLGHALRELHPSDHDPVRAAVGRRRRAPHADAVPLRPQRHCPRRHHPADRHRQEERHHDDRLRARGGA